MAAGRDEFQFFLIEFLDCPKSTIAIIVMKDRANLYEFLHPLKFTGLWRVVWYSVLIWFLGFLISAVVMIPWFYPVLSIVIISTTVFYFKIIDPPAVRRGRRAKIDADKIFAFGLAASLAWFVIIGFLTIAEIMGFYYFNFLFYFSDFRNWYLYALIILVPVLYSLILENLRSTRAKKKSRLLF